jgi:small subunit ribosomal protein S13
MIYFLNTSINNKKRVRFALQKVFGLGRSESNEICDSVGISEEIKISSLSQSQLALLETRIEEGWLIGLDLQKRKVGEKARLRRISSYRGIRHAQGLPCRGQRTHTNAKTVRSLSGERKSKRGATTLKGSRRKKS